MKLKEIYRTATFAWSPSLAVPLIATGTVAGALDESFSNDSHLEIWSPDFLDKNDVRYDIFKASIMSLCGINNFLTMGHRFNRLAWGYVDGGRPRGILAAGMENGELGLWDPYKILQKAEDTESLVMQKSVHSGPVRGLDFNPMQTNLLSTGATNGEIFIWDLNDTSKPYSPGARSVKLEEITAISWNNQVAHIVATASNTGYTVVWDLRAKREIVALAYSGGASTGGGSIHGGAMAMGGRRGMSDISWSPDNATRLVTASEDDNSPIVMSWDLRNARAPEKILTGHEKGVLSLSWCKQDPDLLLSCGKDNRVLCWNPQSSEIIAELPPANNWAFQVQWCPRNPDLLATAFFDGTVGIHSLQSTQDPSATAAVSEQTGADIFDTHNFGQSSQATLSLSQPPKWLRRPASCSFGYGGRLVTVGNLPTVQGRHQSGFVHLHTEITEEAVVERAEKLLEAVDKQTLGEFAEEKTKETANKDEESESWKALLSLFRSNSREELITLFGFSKEGIASQVAEAVKKVKEALIEKQDDLEDSLGTPHEPMVSFVEPEKEPSRDGDGADSPDAPQSTGPLASEATPSEFSLSATSDGTKGADIESTTTEHSLFADEPINGTLQTEAAADFFSSMGTIRGPIPGHVLVPHTNYGHDSSVAATVGSGPPSVASETLKNNEFAIYPKDTSEVDRLLTKALVLGDFESAVSLCIASDRFADAILLAVKGGDGLLQKTQKAYFERQTTTLPYLRLFQSIVTDDLEDIVQNADLREWKEIFVVVCTFAKKEAFSSLVEQLGQRLEFQGNVTKASTVDDAESRAREFRKHATLCYLAATKLEKVINIWVDEMREEEEALQQNVDDLPADASRYTVHAQALQTFIEKVTVFRGATGYVDGDLKQASGEAKTYKLAALYDRYYEYADLLASQGLVDQAVKYLDHTPADYKGAQGMDTDFDVARERLLLAAGANTTPKPIQASAYGPYNPPTNTSVAATSTNPYAPPPSVGPSTQPYQPAAPPSTYSSTNNAYSGPGAYNRPDVPGMAPPPPPASMKRPPPQAPPPPKRDNGGWNDPPALTAGRNTPSQAHVPHKPGPLTAPFANAPTMPAAPSSPYVQGPPTPGLPPPPRGGASTPLRSVGLPPRGPSSQQHPPPGPHGSFPPGQIGHQQPPGPPGQIGHQPPPGQYPPPGGFANPPNLGMQARATPPPQNLGQYARATPPLPQQQGGGRPGYGPGSGHGAPGPVPVQGPPPPGPYGPPPGAQQPGQPHPGGPPPGPHPHQGAPLMRPPPNAGPAPPAASQPPAPPKAPAPTSKYPPGDRSHIPDSSKPTYELLSDELKRMRQQTPPQQKRMVDDTERRLNALFDALNCGTLSKPVLEQLQTLTSVMATRDRDQAMALHVDLLTRGSVSDDIGLWMAGVKQLIIRL
ncbi:hypothetical protein BU17DRAFT_46119 [Hysterangium stoloniferum]|nr:hypothetical protein BU17DRAFT_46119 [Hysterangium stoloniferum]